MTTHWIISIGRPKPSVISGKAMLTAVSSGTTDVPRPTSTICRMRLAVMRVCEEPVTTQPFVNPAQEGCEEIGCIAVTRAWSFPRCRGGSRAHRSVAGTLHRMVRPCDCFDSKVRGAIDLGFRRKARNDLRACGAHSRITDFFDGIKKNLRPHWQ